MKLHYRIILLCILLLGNSCQKNKYPAQNFIDEIKKNSEFIQEDIQEEQKTMLDDVWTQEVSINFNNSNDALQIMKNILKNYGINITINAKDYQKHISYEAQKRKIIDIFSDILEILDLKILIDGKNAVISKDSMYIHNYIIKNLPGTQEKSITTAVDHNFGSTSGNIMKNEYLHKIDYYTELQKNIELLISKEEENCKFSINKQAGVITVIATQKIHKRLSKYFYSISKKLNDEILVEANIIEVILKDRAGMGINWSHFLNSLIKNGLADENKKGFVQNIKDEFQNEKFNRDGNLPIAFSEKSKIFGQSDKLVEMLSYYGEVTSISNPRLVISNNHSGTFKAIENYVYFDFKIDKQESTGMSSDSKKNSDNITKRAEIKTAVVGVIFTVHVLKLEDDRIKLYLKPTITDVNGSVDHDGYRYVAEIKEDQKSKIPTIPRIKTRELETVLTLKNNQTVIIGGLIRETLDNESDFMFNIFSFFGRRFNKKVKKRSELIIVLNVKALDNKDYYDIYEIYFEK